jgi:hypothetical protein
MRVTRALQIFSFSFTIFVISCNEKTGDYKLEEYNVGTANGIIRKVDTFDKTEAKQYCFEIIHEKVNLKSYSWKSTLTGKLCLATVTNQKLFVGLLKLRR